MMKMRDLTDCRQLETLYLNNWNFITIYSIGLRLIMDLQEGDWVTQMPRQTQPVKKHLSCYMKFLKGIMKECPVILIKINSIKRQKKGELKMLSLSFTRNMVVC